VVTVHATPQGDAWTCEVEVNHAGRRTSHTVTVQRQDIERYTSGEDVRSVEHLVERTFDFLLEREPPSSILPDFDLSVVRRYFPEYDQLFRA